MVAPTKYPDELRERAIRLTVESRLDPASRSGACKRIGEQLGINAETLRTWVVAASAHARDRALARAVLIAFNAARASAARASIVRDTVASEATNP